jgi:hypothetical protein
MIVLTTIGCAPRKVIFDGIAVVRPNGQVVVVPHEPGGGIPEEKYLSKVEVDLVHELRRGYAASTHSPLCLTLSGSPYCEAVPPCKNCIVLMATSVNGKISAVEESPCRIVKKPSGLFAYTCKCTAIGY